ncbi:enoyl-CoA hydratase/isomerase family protein [Lysobacter sp. A03]|uniref:enoyl-CoA hydratase/isomerase family protein n=1 Tax=Lysobacter sp. A03 TaxID=1199154 RepID=UPI0005B72D2D|nr:enoyl-CoA hydratase/isomerase family protein [Lysobacter sp. A03]KIQ96172.1 Enoyl-CoA hydratase [Lysobacter sp. A03]
MQASNEVVGWRLDDRVARLRIDRPEKRNALAGVHWAAIERCLAEVHASDARVLVLEGVPGAFSAGADIDELAELLVNPSGFAASNAQVQRTQLALQRSPLTTIAVIDGVCVGGGLGLALACDFRLGSTRSRFGLSPAKLGLVYSPEDSRRLVNTVGLARAREMLLTGRLLFAATALEWGLLNRIAGDDGVDAALATLLAELESGSTSARAGIKQVLAYLGGDAEAGHAAATAAFDDAFASADFAEGAAAFLAKRKPDFQ